MIESEIFFCNDFTGILFKDVASHLFLRQGVLGFGHSPPDAFRQTFGREIIGEETVLFVPDDVCLSAVAEGYGDATAGLCFDERLPERLVEGGGDGDVCGGVQLREFAGVAYSSEPGVADWYGGKQFFRMLDSSEQGEMKFFLPELLFFNQQAEGLQQIFHSLYGVVDAGGAEEDDVFVARQCQFFSGCCLVHHPEVGGGECVGDDGNGLFLEQGTLEDLRGEPGADGNDIQLAGMGEQSLFLLEYTMCQVVPAGEAQEAAVPAFAFEAGAGVGVVADGRAFPHVVHGPDDGFARLQDFLYVADGEHALVNPVKVYDVGFAERR